MAGIMAMPEDIGRSPGLQTTPVEGNPGQPNDATATSVRGPSNIKRERSNKFREFGLYASKASSNNPASPIPTSLPSPASLSKGSASHFVVDHHHHHQPRHQYQHQQYQHQHPHPHQYQHQHQHHHQQYQHQNQNQHQQYQQYQQQQQHQYQQQHYRQPQPQPQHYHHHHHHHQNGVEETYSTANPAIYASYSPTNETYYYESHDEFSSPNHLGPQVPQPPLTPISPRWDSLAHSNTVLYNQSPTLPQGNTKTTVLTLPTSRSAYSSPGLLTPHDYDDDDDISLISETRDDFPSLPSPSPSQITKMNSIENRHVGGEPVTPVTPVTVGNFSRPRRPSVKQPIPDHLRSTQLTHTLSSATDPTPSESPSTHQQNLLWPRERGHSISSNQSTATFNSLPMRPTPDLQLRETARSKSRQGNPSLARPPMAYSRTESSGPRSLSRDPLPRMASMPSDELRSSYRSQRSGSTRQGTLQTERSSVATKNSSITSFNGPGEEEFSVDDVMGMYEKGFRDSLAPSDHYGTQDDMSRPPTGASEMNRRKSAMLEAMSDPLPIPRSAALAVSREDLGTGDISQNVSDPNSIPLDSPRASDASESSERIVRNSTAIFGNSEYSSPPQKEAARSVASGKHDSGKLVDLSPIEDDDEVTARAPQQPANMTLPQEGDDNDRDRYGFRKHNQYVSQEQYDQWNTGYTEYIERRRKKWNSFLKESGLMTENPNRFPQRSTKTKRFVRKGIPPEWRGAAWFYYAGGPAIVAKHAGVYDKLLEQKPKDVDNEAIERDLHRTFPDNIKFRSAQNSSTPNTEGGAARNRSSQITLTGGQYTNAARADETAMISSLRRVLHAFSIYNPRIGYCQSLNFLAGLLLLFVETEEQAFWLLNIITRVYLPGTHEMSLEGANVDLAVLMSSLRDAMPAVWSKIGGELDGTDAVKPKSRRYRKGPPEPTRLPPITLCMTAWFMSCFIGTLPIETTLRVWDVFFYEGSKTLFRIALAIFKIGENEIKSVSDPMEIFQVVQTIPRRLIDANGLMESCFKRRNGFGHLSQETIEQRRQERRDNVKIERERMAAGHGDGRGELKKKNTVFSKKTR